MKKTFTLFLLALVFVSQAMAQRIVEATNEFSDYDRNGLSVIATTYGDKYDANFVSIVESLDFGDKFDINQIITKSVSLSGSRTTVQNQNRVLNVFKPDGITNASINTQLYNNNVGKQIFDYVLQRDKEGRFSRKLLDKRGEWNATDRDVMESQMMQVNAVGQNGEALIEKSFVVVYDMKNPTRRETKSKDKNGKEIITISWSVNMSAYVYRIDNSTNVIGRVVNDMWIYDNDDKATKLAKKQAYDELQVKFVPVTAVAVTYYGDNVEEAVAGSFDNLMMKLENKIVEWQVAIDCETVNPFITAKIGEKEGVRNGTRYAIFGQVYNPKKEVNEFKRKGYVRATEVADNKKVADGKADVTYFYRISGVAPLKGNEILKEKKDFRMGISLGFNVNGSLSKPKESKMFGSFSMLDIGLDYLVKINKRGASHYILLNFGLDFQSGTNIEDGHYEFGEYLTAYNEDGEFMFKNGLLYYNASFGYMYGVKLYHFMEIQPFVRIGADMMGKSMKLADYYELAECESQEPSDPYTLANTKNRYSIYLDPGVRVTFNVYYPVQIFFQANYSVNLFSSESYKLINDYLKDSGYGHGNGLGIGGGIKLCL